MKKTAINPINKKDNKCFQQAVTVALNHEEIKKDLQRITKIEPFTNKYNQVEINFPSEKDDRRTFEKNHATSAPNVFFCCLFFYTSNLQGLTIQQYKNKKILKYKYKTRLKP